MSFNPHHHGYDDFEAFTTASACMTVVVSYSIYILYKWSQRRGTIFIVKLNTISGKNNK